MDYLSKLENSSIYIIREAYHQFQKVATLWSVGKDSTTLLYLIRKAFFGKIPFPENIWVPEASLTEKGIKVFEIARGGDVTFHCPGQLVDYPIIDLSSHRKDLHNFA